MWRELSTNVGVFTNIHRLLVKKDQQRHQKLTNNGIKL